MKEAIEGPGSNQHQNFLVRRFGEDRYGVYLVILIVTFTVIHLVINIFLGIRQDEASWWFATKHLELGYFLHPPFITYELFIITKIFGESVFALRLGSLFFTVGSIILVYYLALELFKDKKWAFIATLIFALLPITNYWLMLAHQGAPFIFFWLLTVWLVWRAISRDSKGFWYLTGVSAGFMLLCKLQAVLFLPCLLLFLLTSSKHRYWLKRKEPYLALLIVLLMFTPTLIWYASHDFEPITYQLSARPGFVNRGIGEWFSRTVDHLGGSMLIVSYFVYLFSIFGMVYGGYLGFKGKDQRFLFLFWFSVPVVVFFIFTGGWPYWPFCGHIMSLLAAVGATPIFISRTSRNWVKKSWKPAMLLLLIILPLLISSVYCGFSLIRSKAHHGWIELAEEIEEVRETMDDAEVFVAAPYHSLLNPTAYYVRDGVNGYTLMFRGYEYENFGMDTDYAPWIPIANVAGKDVIFVDERENPDDYETPVSYWEEKLPPYFEGVEGPTIFTEEMNGVEFRTFYIFKCYGFKGPDDHMDSKGDIRRYVEQGESVNSLDLSDGNRPGDRALDFQDFHVLGDHGQETLPRPVIDMTRRISEISDILAPYHVQYAPHGLAGDTEQHVFIGRLGQFL